MVPLAYVYDPTTKDEQSKIRGIGRYLQILREGFMNESNQDLQTATDITNQTFSFVSDLKSVPTNSIFINPFFNFTQKPIKIRRIAKKQIAVIHDLIPLKYKSHFPMGLRGFLYKFLNNWTLKNYDLIVTVSEQSKKDIMFFLKIPANRIEVIHSTVPKMYLPHLETHDESVEHHHPFHLEADHSVAEFSNVSLETSQNPVLAGLRDFILYVGDATWNKNLPYLAQVVKMANVPCVCVGKVFATPQTNAPTVKPNPWLASLQIFQKMVQNDKLFIFPGYVSDIELLSLYKRAKLNIAPSIDEGFGFSFLEAGYMSTPSVMTDIPVFREIAGEGAEYAPLTAPKEMAQKVSEIFYDNMKREKMSINAFTQAQNYPPQLFKERWIQVVQSLNK